MCCILNKFYIFKKTLQNVITKKENYETHLKNYQNIKIEILSFNFVNILKRDGLSSFYLL